MAIAKGVQALADRLAEQPFCFHYLRKLPELNYGSTRTRIRAVHERCGAGRVLDAGCGTGEFARLFPASGYVGVDIHPGYVGFARRHNPDYRFECADVVEWPGDGEPFDLVLVNGVLHHLDDATARSLIEAALRQLRSGGTLLLIEDAEVPGLASRLVHALDHGHHIRTPDEWDRLVGGVIAIDERESYRSGICPYRLMTCRKP